MPWKSVIQTPGKDEQGLVEILYADEQEWGRTQPLYQADLAALTIGNSSEQLKSLAFA